MCSQTVTSWGNPAGHGWVLPPPLSSWRLRLYRLHCLHGWWSLWLSHQCTLWGLWWLSHQCTLWGLWWLNHQCTLWGLAVCCFLEWEAWSLTLFCLLAILDSAFPGFLAGVSQKDAEISLGTFLTHWFASDLFETASVKMYPHTDNIHTQMCIHRQTNICMYKRRGTQLAYFEYCSRRNDCTCWFWPRLSTTTIVTLMDSNNPCSNNPRIRRPKSNCWNSATTFTCSSTP